MEVKTIRTSIATPIKKINFPYKKNFYIKRPYFKRTVDFSISLIILTYSLPLFFIIAGIIKLESKGSALFKQERLGAGGKPFILYKFRTMYDNAELNTGPVWSHDRDERITPLGRMLRKFRIDELPQLWNVIRGDMSLVGPRPERRYFVERHPELNGIRLSVKPGITGLAQVQGLYNTHPRSKTRYDRLYIKRHSILLDIKILLKTVIVVLTRKGT